MSVVNGMTTLSNLKGYSLKLYPFSNKEGGYLNRKPIPVKELIEANKEKEKQPPKTNATDLQYRIDELKRSFNNTHDLIFYKNEFGNNNEHSVQIIYFRSIVNTAILNQSVIAPLIQYLSKEDLKVSDSFVSDITNKALAVSHYEKTTDMIYVQNALLDGGVAIVFDGFEEVILIGNAFWSEKSLSTPTVERSFFGMDIGFTEHAETNINVIRNFLKSEHFTSELHQIGNKSKTEIYVLYMNDIVDREILNKANEKIKKINIDFMTSTRIIALYLQGKQSLFPLSLRTDRPDTIISDLLQGKVVVMMNGSPYPLVLPSLFLDFFQSPAEYEDNYSRFSGRLIRIFNYFMTILLPALYIAFVNLDLKDLPKSIDKALMPQGEIINTFWQLVLLSWILRSLIDGTMRLSSSAIILVTMLGTLVVGENLATLKIVHPFSLIMMGLIFLTASSVGNKGLQNSFVTLRHILMIIAYFFGFTGITIGMVIILIYMCTLKSMGVPYMSPLIPFKPKEIKDSFVRGNLKKILNSKHDYKKGNS